MTLLACGSPEPEHDSEANAPSRRDSAPPQPTSRTPEEEPKQWTLREVARRLTDGGLVVTDSGRASLRHSFLDVEGHRMRVSGSELQIFIYPDPASRKVDSEPLDTARAAPADMRVDWPTTPHLIASGNLIAIHLTPNGRLAERVRLILEAWHAGS